MRDETFYKIPMSMKNIELRDWFAGQALSGWMSGLRADQAVDQELQDSMAASMYSMADAMLLARKL